MISTPDLPKMTSSGIYTPAKEGLQAHPIYCSQLLTTATNPVYKMTSLAKAAYSAKIRRQSAPPALPPSPPPSPPPTPAADRTGIKVQEIPPQLCHLTGDELAMPFPPIALGGYIRYYRDHPDVCEQGLAKLDLGVKNRMQDANKRQKASASPRSSLLPSPTSSSSSSESLPHPICSAPPPPPRRPILSIIREDSRETMRCETKEHISLPITPYKARVASHPSTSLTLSLPVSSSPGYSSSPNTSMKSNSPAQTALSSPRRGSLRRRKRQILRTPSVENDFARSAKELFGLKKDPGLISISRANSTGSEMTEGEEDPILSATASVSTALTSVSDTQSIISSVTSPTPFRKNDRSRCSNHDHDTTSMVPSRRSRKLSSNSNPNNKPAPLSLDHHHSDSDGSSSSPTISTPSTSFTHRGLLTRAEFGLLDFDQDEAENEGGGGSWESWASYVTAKDYLDPSLPIVLEAN